MLGKSKQTTFHLYKWSIPVQKERDTWCQFRHSYHLSLYYLWSLEQITYLSKFQFPQKYKNDGITHGGEGHIEVHSSDTSINVDRKSVV